MKMTAKQAYIASQGIKNENASYKFIDNLFSKEIDKAIKLGKTECKVFVDRFTLIKFLGITVEKIIVSDITLEKVTREYRENGYKIYYRFTNNEKYVVDISWNEYGEESFVDEVYLKNQKERLNENDS